VAAAFVTVLVGLPVEHLVNELRDPRNQKLEAYLQSKGGPDDGRLRDEALEAKATFGTWHLFSVLLNLGTVALVTAGMALAARLPEGGGHELATEQNNVLGRETQVKV
jgi:hypothetical protein